jgi:hypothetical protein
MALGCSMCPYWTALLPGDLGYDSIYDGLKGYCTLCPPIPNGEYKGELSDWPITYIYQLCNLCRCRGCGEYTPPIPRDSYLLTETSDYVLTETGFRIILG